MSDVYESLSKSAVAIHRDAGVARVSGPDRVAWLQGMVSNDVAGLAPGSGCYAAHLNARGKVLSLMRVLADEEALWVELDGDSPQSVAELDKWIVMEDAEILDHSENVSVLAIVGAGARSALEAWTGTRLELARPYAHTVIQSFSWRSDTAGRSWVRSDRAQARGRVGSGGPGRQGGAASRGEGTVDLICPDPGGRSSSVRSRRGRADDAAGVGPEGN